jgi:alpha-1,2-mannosyltransferase
VRFPPLHMPFTYTPVAAVLFVPLTWSSWAVVRVVVTSANVVAVFACAALAIRLASGRMRWQSMLTAALVLGAVSLWTEPVQQTLLFGQINLLMLLLVLVDLNLADTSRWKGCAIGLAAVVKLTPAVFIAYLVVTGRRVAAARAVGVAVAAVAVATALLPSASWHYWTHGIFETGRIGNPVYVGNQSIRGVLARVFGLGPVTQALWLVLAATALAMGLVWGARLHRAGHDLAGASTVAVAGLLASPYSWSHHWVWVIPILALAWEATRRSDSLAVRLSPLALVASFAAWWIARAGVPGGYPSGIIWLVPAKHSVERHWGIGQTLVGDLYVELAVLAAVAVGVHLLRRGGRWVRSACVPERGSAPS